MSRSKSDLIVVGVITGAHGVRGDVRVKSFTAEPASLFEYAPFYDQKGDLLITPKSTRPAKNHFVVSPKEFRQKEEWDVLRGTKLYVSREQLPKTEEDEFYIDELIGLTVQTGGDTAVGKVKAVHDHGAGDLLEIAPIEAGKSVLVPFTKEDVPVIDLALGRIVVATYDIWADEGDPDKETDAP
ncbi:MAG: ribosome maturation factor RimM [Henriciella sp.]